MRSTFSCLVTFGVVTFGVTTYRGGVYAVFLFLVG